MPLNLSDVVGYVEANIGDFHRRKAENLGKLKLFDVLARKNPYLFDKIDWEKLVKFNSEKIEPKVKKSKGK